MKLKDTIELGLLYVGVPALTLYPLGFVGLGIEMWRDPFFPYYDFQAIYNAVALVPNTIVAGTGVKLLYLSAISTLIGAVIASLTFRFLARSKRENAGSPETRAGSWSLFLLVLLPIAVLLMYYQVTVEGWDDAPYVAGFLVFSVVGGILTGGASFRDGASRRLLLTLAGAYTMAILAALCLAPLQTPSLPLVHADAGLGPDLPCSEAADKTFVKLNLEDDYWHLYNESGLYAVPSAEMEKVRYVLREECPSLMDRN